jgi:acyl-CoA thioester hydrolase
VTPGVHRHEIVVAGSEIDGLGHANNVVWIRWMIDAATSHSAAAGWDMQAYERAGGIFIVRRHEIDYLAPAKAGDAVEVYTWVASFQAATSVRRTEMRLGGRPCARGETKWVFVDLATGRPRRIPAEVKAAFVVVGGEPEIG